MCPARCLRITGSTARVTFIRPMRPTNNCQSNCSGVSSSNNYYPQRDGHIAELDNESTTTAELLQAHLPTSKVVKAFNHIYAAELTTHGQTAGSKNRRALVIAGDDADAKAVVTNLLDEFGFDTVDAGPLREGWRIQRDTPGYGPRRTAEELRKDLASAKRYAEQ